MDRQEELERELARAWERLQSLRGAWRVAERRLVLRLVRELRVERLRVAS